MSIEEIKKRLEDANKTDWRIKSHIDEQGQTHINWQDLNNYNMRLVAHAPADIAFLLAENQRLVEALERADKAFQRLSTGDFNAPMELSQIEAYQAYAASAHQWLQAYKLLERKEK